MWLPTLSLNPEALTISEAEMIIELYVCEYDFRSTWTVYI